MGILCVFCVYDTIGNRCFEENDAHNKISTHVTVLPAKSDGDVMFSLHSFRDLESIHHLCAG